MPAAAAKVERINDQAGDLNNNKMKMTANQQNPSQDPTKIANTIIEKKIRNLEKRKARLLEIKALEDKGQQLEPDQVTAVKKLDSVVEMIDTLKEINKNVTDSLNEYAKQLKKQQKKEQMDKMNERHQIEIDRSILLLRIENVLSRHSSTSEYLTTLDEKQQKALDSFVKIFHEKNRNNYVEKVFLIIDGSKKEFSDGLTYLEMKDLLEKLIENCSVKNQESNVKEVEKVAETSKENPISKESHKVNDESPNKPQTNQMSPHYSATKKPLATTVEVDLQKDPAVIASGFVIPSFPSGNFIPANNGMEMPLIYPTTIVNSSIPSQTFTNTSYAGFIQNKVPMFEQTVPITNPVTFNENLNLVVNMDPTPKTSSNDKVELVNGSNVATKVESPEKAVMNSEHTSQENDSKVDDPNVNGNSYNKRNYRGNNRGNSRNFSGNYRGRGSQKNFGYFNGQQNSDKGGQYSTNFTIGNFNGNRATTRQNGGGGNGNGGGTGRNNYYRSNERHNNNRNHFNANTNTYQGPSATLISKQ